MDPESLREHYKKLPNEDIERLANFEADQLSPEALAVLRDEIRNRGLSDDLRTTADIQVKGVSEEEVEQLIRRVSQFPCPLCGRRQNYLNAFSIMSVRSLILLTSVERPLVIACPQCISAYAKSELIKSLLLGWWGIPWGAIRTVHSFFVNWKALNADDHHTPTREFIDFVRPYSAAIKARIDKISTVDEFLELTAP